MGALLVAATGRIEGWRTVNLGANLPAEEIAAAARQR
jgi:methanogenic corrinoid protein MtbC1